MGPFQEEGECFWKRYCCWGSVWSWFEDWKQVRMKCLEEGLKIFALRIQIGVRFVCSWVPLFEVLNHLLKYNLQSWSLLFIYFDYCFQNVCPALLALFSFVNKLHYLICISDNHRDTLRNVSFLFIHEKS